jgi:integrase
MKTRKGYLIRRGKTFYAVWTVAGQKFTVTTRQTNRRDAETRLAEIMAPFLIEDEIRTLETVKARIEGAKASLAVYDEQRNPPLGFGVTRSADGTEHPGAWSIFLKAQNRPDSGKRTLDDYEGYYQAFADWLKSTKRNAPTLRDVTPDIANDYAGHLSERRLSAGTFNKHINTLALVFRVLTGPARLTINVWDGINRKKAVQESRRELTIEELRRVCAAAIGELRVLLAIGLYTGLRLGDAATLRWGETDLVRGLIQRIPHKTARRNPRPVNVPIHPTLRAMLDEIPMSDRRNYVLPETAAAYLRDTSAPSKRIQDHFEACGIILHKHGTGFVTELDKDGKPKSVHTGQRAVVEVGFHSLRHSFVSLCRGANAPLSVVESIVGHSSPAMTRHYTHTGEAAALAAVSSLPSLTGEVKALPTSQTPQLLEAGMIRARLEGMRTTTWRAIRDELLRDLVIGKSDEAGSC